MLGKDKESRDNWSVTAEYDGNGDDLRHSLYRDAHKCGDTMKFEPVP